MTDHEIEASVIGGLLLGGYTPDATDILATLDDDAFSGQPLPVRRSGKSDGRRKPAA